MALDILLNDLLNLTEEEIENSKISLNITSGKNGPLCIDYWLKDGSTKDGYWAYTGKRKNFKVDQYCFVFYKLSLSGDEYLFVNAGKITRVPNENESVPAEYEPIDKYKKYFGRAIINVYKGNTRGAYNFTLKHYIDNCKIVEVLPEIYGGEAFPGFKNLRLNYNDLYRGIYIDRSWKAYLQSQKAIYVIVDKAPECEYSGYGRIYIGSATSSKGMLYDRWKNYVDSLTGGNKEFQHVINDKGPDYIKKYYQWSVIEHYNEETDDAIILEREKYWKLVLDSKNQGLNDNY